MKMENNGTKNRGSLIKSEEGVLSDGTECGSACPFTSNPLVRFMIDYCQRHKHPANAAFHMIGVPAAFYGMFELVTGKPLRGAILIVFGYFLQYLGHKAQGNEVGEVTLIKLIYGKLKNKFTSP
jgi:Protein of unknown function (DUF962).